MKTYFITGASSDIGRAYIKSLEAKDESCLVLGHCRDCKALDALAAELSYVNLEPLPCDLSDAEQTRQMLEKIVARGFKPSHVLHLAAEPLIYKRVKELDWNSMACGMQIQVGAALQIMQRLLPIMKKQGQGKVVLMLSSVTLGAPPKFMAEYVIAKYALLGLMKSLAVEYGGNGISINGLSPSMVETKFLANIDERMVETAARSTFMGRNVRISEVVGAIDYLMSDEAGYLNGFNLNMTGGDRM